MTGIETHKQTLIKKTRIPLKHMKKNLTKMKKETSIMTFSE